MSQSKGLYHQFEYRDTPAKWKGVFAIKDIIQGDEISSLTPIFKSKHTFDAIEILEAMHAAGHHAKESFRTLPYIPSAAEMAEAETMINASKSPEMLKKETLVYLNLKQAATRIAKFLHYRVKVPGLPTAGAITYLDIVSRFHSRLNHSCVPNCWISWNEAKGEISAHAIRDIKKEEELLIFYDVGDLFFMKREARMQALQTEYGFKCACPACDPNDPDTGERIAQRRERLADLRERIQIQLAAKDVASLESTYSEMLNHMNSKIDGWEKGKIYLNLANVYENMGTAYHVRAQQQLEEAKRVAKKCIDQDHKEVQDIQENIDRLERIRHEAAGKLFDLSKRSR